MKIKSLFNALRTSYPILILLGWSALMLCILTLQTITAQIPEQSQGRVIEQAFSSNPQVKVTRIKTGEQVRKFDEAFNDDDWLKNLSFQVENISQKPIIYLQFNLNFPETKSSGNLMSYPVILGQKPGSKLIIKNEPLLLRPGQTLEISLSEHYSKLAQFLETRHPLNMIRKAQVEIGFIVFEDTTAWSAGQFYRQDTNDPNRYINVGTSPTN